MHARSICIAALGCAIALAAAGCGGDTEKIVKTPPVVSAVDPAVTGFGDTIVVTGSGFNADLSANLIVVSPSRFDAPAARRLVTPFAGSATELRGIVPDGAYSGKIRIENMSPAPGIVAPGLDFYAASAPVDFGVRLRRGEVGKAFFSGSGYVCSIEAGPASEDYLVVLFSDAVAPDNTWDYFYNIYASTQTALATAGSASMDRRRVAAAPPASAGGRHRASAALPGGERDIDFARRIDEQTRRILDRAGAGVPAGAGNVRGGRVAQEEAVPASESFYVLEDVTKPIDDPSSYVTIQADLRFTGAHTLLYVDTETPAANLAQADIDNLGRAFDERIYDGNRAAFGNESDINADGRVTILMSPGVNRLTPAGSAQSDGYIAGYFLPNDLLPGLVNPRATNAREIFYTVVPDPTGAYGNVLERARVLPVIEAVLAHEFLHMILFNYRVLVYGDGYSGAYMEEVWLNEGLAHIAEDVNGYTGSNVARANLFLADPGDVTLIYGGDGLEERGAAFLFLRLLGDRFGESIFRDLVQSRRIGTANVAAAAGAYFVELFADWAAALWLSDRGVTDDPRFNYTSFDLQAAFADLLVIPGTFESVGNQGSVRSMAPEYLSFTVPAGARVEFRIEGGANGRFNAIVVRTR